MKRNYLNKTKTGLKTLLAGLFLFGTLSSEAQCSASLSYSVGPNGSVSYVSTSTGTSISTYYSWNFYGAGTSNGSATTRTFTSNGFKPVCLTIISNTTSATSCTSTVCDSVLITNVPTSSTSPCNANFNYSIGANGVVNFASTSTGTSVSTNYSWNFGSGTGTGVSPAFTYGSNGTKWVCLTITNSVTGCSSTYCDSLYITTVGTSTTTACNANFNYSIGPNGAVSFVSTSTGTTASTHYYWTFSGGTSAIGNAPTRIFTSNGYKQVCLIITSNTTIPGSCTSTKCDSVLVTNVTPSTTPCSASFSYSIGANGLVNFASTSTGTSVSTNYAWSFNGSYSGTGLNPSYTYTSNGFKWICLTITNSVTGCSSTACDSLLITNTGGSVTPCNPSVMYTLSKDSTMALTWNAYPSYPANATNATWYWGDGTSTTGLYPSHTYSAPGTYSTCVTVSVSCSSSITATYCYVASIFRSSQSNDMLLVNVKQATPTGIKNQTKAEGQLSIYPNPNNGEFVLELNNATNEVKENTVVVYNMLGEKVFEKQVMANGKQTIDVSSLSSGTYLVKVNSKDSSLHKRITIQK